jgi:L-asparaginase II
MNPVLVEQWRGNLVETLHRGAVCVADAEGNVVFSTGDIHQKTYPRSALKFLQHLVLLESGAADHFQFTLAEIALMAGSHNGESHHVETAQSILQKIGLGESNLQCGAHPPFWPVEAERFFRQNRTSNQLFNNCSGKHAGFLAACIFLGYPLENYLDPEHPLQQKILKKVMEFCNIGEVPPVAIDGCSAPIWGLSVYEQALGYAQLVHQSRFEHATGKACRVLLEAVSAHPEMVAGTDRYDTEMMQLLGDRVVGKVGAEGIFCLGFRRKNWGACIKIDDGKMLPQYLIAQELLNHFEELTDFERNALKKWNDLPVVNWKGIRTGEHRSKLSLPRE